MAKKAAASRPPSKPVVAKLLTPVQEFIRTESASGVLLIGAAALAFAWANSPWAASYFALLDLPFSLRFGAWSLEKPLLLWVNDLLMAVFFFVIGLEIKREVLVGELAGWRRASLPAAAALGGMLVPALIYVAFNPEEPAIARLGRADGDRHRVRARRAGAARGARAAQPQGVPAGARDRRRSRSGLGDRPVLHRRAERRLTADFAAGLGRRARLRPRSLARGRCCSPCSVSRCGTSC